MSGLIIAISGLIALIIVRLALGDIGTFGNIELGFSSIIGKREVDADNYEWAVYKDELLLTLANGIGQGTKGRTASRVATYTIARVFELAGTSNNPEYFFQTSYQGANNAVDRYIPDGTGGASVISAVIKNGILHYALVGNCQLVVYRNGELIRISEGHTLSELAVRAFDKDIITREEAILLSEDDKIYNFIGKEQFRDLEIIDVPIVMQKNDILLLMTDGVFDYLPGYRIVDCLSYRKSAQRIADAIMNELEHENYANQDNASVIVARINKV